MKLHISAKRESKVAVFMGAQIRKRRIALGYEQRDLAELMNFTKQRITQAEGGKCCIHASSIPLLCAALKCSPVDLFPEATISQERRLELVAGALTKLIKNRKINNNSSLRDKSKNYETT